MSERLDDIPAAAPATPRESAVVIVARRTHAGRELLMHRRSMKTVFLPGHWAFPGGRLDDIDEPSRDGAHARCAARELHEECGLSVDAELLRPIGLRTTPPFHPMRFRTQFFFVELPADTTVSETPASLEESDEQAFVDPRAAHDAWARGEWPMPPVLPPLLRQTIELRNDSTLELAQALTMVNELEELTPRIEFLPGVWLVPQRSATLPPASHTNAYLLGGRRFLIVDPGSDDPSELALLVDTVQRRRRDGDRAEAIVLTHHHRDHVAGAPALADLLRLPIRAHAEAAARLTHLDAEISSNLREGDELDLEGMTAIVRHTPGHAAGHIALHVPEFRFTLCGDLISGVSTIVIDPDDGDMTQYLKSLSRMAALDPGQLFPSHGPPQRASALREAIDHRLEREAQIRAARAAGHSSVESIVRAVYGDTVHHKLAQLQVRAHLARLDAS